MKKLFLVMACAGAALMAAVFPGVSRGQTPVIVGQMSITTDKYTGDVSYYNSQIYEIGDQNDNKIHIRNMDGSIASIWAVPVTIKAINGICYDSKRNLFWYHDAATRVVRAIVPGGSTTVHNFQMGGDDAFAKGMDYDEITDCILAGNPEEGQIEIYSAETYAKVAEINTYLELGGVFRVGNYYWVTYGTGDNGNAFLAKLNLDGTPTGVSMQLPNLGKDYDVGGMTMDAAGYLWIRGGEGTAIYQVDIGYVPTACDRTGMDYNGDGTTDVAVFRPADGLWSVQDITRVYLGQSGDDPVPADYNGDGVTDIAVFRPGTGLWVSQNFGRNYFGGANDVACPADYDGDGSDEQAVFDTASGRWAIQGITRFYLGQAGDVPVFDDFNCDGTADAGVYRGIDGLWAIRGVTRANFGLPFDHPVPGDYTGAGSLQLAVARDGTGEWAIRGVTRMVFGGYTFFPQPADWNGDGRNDVASFWNQYVGSWAMNGIGDVLFGSAGDLPVSARIFQD